MFPLGGCDPGLGHDQPISESDFQQIAAQAALKIKRVPRGAEADD